VYVEVIYRSYDARWKTCTYAHKL